MSVINACRLDRTAFQVASLFDEPDEKEYWLSRTPQERLEALELMRQVVYGYDPSVTRLQSSCSHSTLTGLSTWSSAGTRWAITATRLRLSTSTCG